MKKALVAIDLSDLCRELIGYAFSFALSEKLEKLDFLHIRTAPDLPIPTYIGDETMVEHDRISEELSEIIRREVERKGVAPVEWDLLVCNGIPYEQIIERAEQEEYEYILIGHRGMSDLKRFFIGSVALKVVGHAPCKVLIYQ